jgi:hypothetical protein
VLGNRRSAAASSFADLALRRRSVRAGEALASLAGASPAPRERNVAQVPASTSTARSGWLPGRTRSSSVLRQDRHEPSRRTHLAGREEHQPRFLRSQKGMTPRSIERMVAKYSGSPALTMLLRGPCGAGWARTCRNEASTSPPLRSYSATSAHSATIFGGSCTQRDVGGGNERSLYWIGRGGGGTTDDRMKQRKNPR